MTPADEEFEDGLAEMLDFLAGKGKYRGLGKGRVTEPEEHPREMEDHATLCELRRRGLARRRKDGKAWVWEATGFKRTEGKA